MSKTLSIGALLILCASAAYGDVYLRVPVSQLTISGGKVPGQVTSEWKYRNKAEALAPYAVLEGEGEIYAASPRLGERRVVQEFDLLIHLPAQREVKGKLFAPKEDLSGMVTLDFSVPAGAARDVAESEFLSVKREHYRTLAQRAIPGAAWFRHQAAERNANNRGGRPDRSEFQATFDLFSGGRAISENLQLDRDMRASGAGESTVDVASLGSITTREMDWEPIVKSLKPKKDFLAAFVPADQHVIFFPSFTAMTSLIDEADRQGTPVLQWLEPRSEDAYTRERYQKQLCLELNRVSRLLGPQVITSIAMTGSDPYLRTGTDVGILFEVKSPAVLKSYLTAQQAEAKKNARSAETVGGDIEGIAYTGIVTPDREISSYVAESGSVVYVCNSLAQLRNLIEVAKGKRPTLASTPEYTFFRHRYAAGQSDESAFVVLTDATIRRWCGPRWRIGNSRRTRVAAALAELQAAHLDELVKGAGDSKLTDPIAADAGDILMGGNKIVSSKYGNLEFLTPIAELSFDKATKQEADAYKAWRDSYQRNWQQFFDPIALRFGMDGRKIKAEVTVMPLIARTDYNEFIRLTSGAAIAPGANDPHKDALVHLAMSINTQSEMFQKGGNFLGTMNPSFKANPLGWLGQSISLYADADPFWKKLENNEKAEQFMEKNWHQLPVALHAEVKNPLGLAAFLTTLRAYVDQTAPQMTRWQNLEYNGQAYVRVGGSPALGDNEFAQASIYYVVTPKSLVLTLNEALLKRAIDRAKAGKADTANIPPWLGTNLCLQLGQDFLTVLGNIFNEKFDDAQQLLSWKNIAILNEWKRLYPDQDPVTLHEKYWHARLVCPGGGKYVWNDKWKTMESSVYGHPGEPREAAGKTTPLAGYRFANFGLSFENQGLSAKVQVETTGNAGKVAAKGR